MTVPMERVADRILSIRRHRVILDADLAVLYGVATGALNQAVKRNAERFPGDFMFRLTAEEGANLKSQIVISNGWGGRRRSLPLAFTEQGVAMLSGVLNSSRAITGQRCHHAGVRQDARGDVIGSGTRRAPGFSRKEVCRA
jgi:hypothetical protein